jgi:hypothetical protein
MARYVGVVRDVDGDVIPSAFVTVYDEDTTTLSSIYSDETLVTSENNPLQADGNGRYSFFCPPARYKIKITKAGFNDLEEDDILIGTIPEHRYAFLLSPQATFDRSAFAIPTYPAMDHSVSCEYCYLVNGSPAGAVVYRIEHRTASPVSVMTFKDFTIAGGTDVMQNQNSLVNTALGNLTLLPNASLNFRYSSGNDEGYYLLVQVLITYVPS